MKPRQMWKMCSRVWAAAFVACATLLSYQPAQASIYPVTTTNDSGPGSLRSAIESANLSPGPHTIRFNISGCGGVCVIQPDTPLPALTSGGVTIDGYTQTGAAPATVDTAATILVELDGRYVIVGNGLVITSSNNVIRGLSIHRFQHNGIAIGTQDGSTANGNRVEGNYLGVPADGLFPLGNGFYGVFIGLGAQNNTVGGETPAARNIISANGGVGVGIHGTETSGNTVMGNYIGTHIDGAGGLENGLDGVLIYGGSSGNTIGGDTAARRNLLSGNKRDGVRIQGAGADGNRVTGNHIGVDVSGIGTLENQENGVHILGGAQNNTIGGDTAAARNVISANFDSGVLVEGASTQGNLVANNYIGLGGDGSYDLGNGDNGVYLYGAPNNTIGPGNVISGNAGSGIEIELDTATGNVAFANRVGTNAIGTTAAGNDRHGVYVLDQAANNTIGPDNLISGNASIGLWIDAAHGNQVFGNYIGTDVSGNASLGNETHGVMIGANSTDNTIGGDSPAHRNIISGNTDNGIKLSDGGTISTTISGNYIGLAANGNLALGNGGSGIEAENGVHDFTIGGDAPGEGNVISGNGGYGLAIHGVDTRGFVISGNYVGTDASGSLDRGNASSGVHLYTGAHSGLVGGDSSGERNVISGNDDSGMDIWGGSTGVDDVVISGNYIGLAADGASGLGNSEHGILLSVDVFDITIGGDAAAQGNIISANGGHGVYLRGADITQNTLLRNIIGSDASGLTDLGNGQNGVMIDNSAHDNTVGPGNLIVHNSGDGVGVDSPGALGNTISQNSMYANRLAGIQLSDGGNNNLPAPVIVNVSLVPLQVTGTACPACLVEVFASQDDEGEGQYFLGSVTAQASTGEFSLGLGFLAERYVTATATDTSDGTSEFSAAYETTIRSVLLPYIGR